MRLFRAGFVVAALAACSGGGSGGGPTPPIVAGFVPASGPPGTDVVVQGSGLAGATSVTFGGVPAGVYSTSDTSVITSVPWDAVTGAVGVTTPGGTATSTGVFTVPLPFWNVGTASTASALLAVTWTGSQYVAVGGNGAIVTSPDAVTWTPRFSSTSQPLFGVASSGSLVVAVGGQGNRARVLLTSPDGVSWTAPCVTYTNCNPPPVPPVSCGGCCTNDGLHAILWTGAQFVTVGADSGGGVSYASSTGAPGTWALRGGCDGISGVASANLWGLGWSGSRLVAMGEGGTSNNYGTSLDALTWSRQNLVASGIGPVTITGVASSGPLFAAVGYGGVVLLSADGYFWQSQVSGTTQDLYGIAWAGDRFVAVGKSGTTLTSPDGMTWTVEYSGTAADINAVAWTGSRLVAVGYQGLVLTAP